MGLGVFGGIDQSNGLVDGYLFHILYTIRRSSQSASERIHSTDRMDVGCLKVLISISIIQIKRKRENVL